MEAPEREEHAQYRNVVGNTDCAAVAWNGADDARAHEVVVAGNDASVEEADVAWEQVVPIPSRLDPGFHYPGQFAQELELGAVDGMGSHTSDTAADKDDRGVDAAHVGGVRAGVERAEERLEDYFLGCNLAGHCNHADSHCSGGQASCRQIARVVLVEERPM